MKNNMFSFPQKMINEKYIWLKRKFVFFLNSGILTIKYKLSFVELNTNTRESYRVFSPQRASKILRIRLSLAYFI